MFDGGRLGLLMLLFGFLAAGMFIGSILPKAVYAGYEKPFSFRYLFASPDVDSPYDHIPESSIHVFQDRIVLDIKNASWASFTDTNSMDPFIDAGANSIEIKPKSEHDIHIGDVISFKTEYADGIIIHRVVDIGEDNQGRYFITKGDNNPEIDPGKRRFEDIQGIVVAVVY